MQRHRMQPHKKNLQESGRGDAQDPFNPWDDPLGLGPLDPAQDHNSESSLPEDAPTATAEEAAGPESGELAALRAEMEELRLRSAAEMENFKKRLQREHDEHLRYAGERVLSDILPSLDNLDLALQYGSKNEACNDLLQGVSMTRKLLLEAVARHGLTPFGQEGDVFTPELYEAVGVEKRDGLGNGAVSRVLQAGYRLGDKVLRPAKVMIHQ